MTNDRDGDRSVVVGDEWEWGRGKGECDYKGAARRDT